MLRVEVSRYRSIPQEIKNMHLPDYCDFQTADYILIYEGMELLSWYSDDMAPEDASFRRDLRWVKKEIEKAYRLGVQDGQKLNEFKKGREVK